MPLAVFLIEDDLRICESIGITLVEVLDARVVGVAQTAADAVAWLAEHDGNWDIAVVDLFLKEGTGFTVLAHLIPKRRRQCVVLTNWATPQNIARCLGLGASAVFDKSLQVDAFINYCSQFPAA